MSKSDFSQSLLASSGKPQTAADQIPIIARFAVSDRAKETLNLVEKFVEEECIPADTVFHSQIGEGHKRWTTYPPVIDYLKARARKLGLWNLFLPKNHFKEGAGFSNLEYGLMAEWLGKSRTASEATNCAAPDTGNMEVLAKYGNDAQKKEWLAPLLEGKIRSAFLMTEPDVASSDATNITLTMKRQGNEYVLNGTKWWSSGAGDPRCKVYIVMGKSDPSNHDSYKQQSVILVAAGTPGVAVQRVLSVYGYDDAPHGHAQIKFENVRVPASNIVLGEGRGFEIIQGRLGPGRIHHAMRSIGAAERALEWMIARVNDTRKKTFGKPLSEHGVLLEWIAKSRLEIDAARLIVLNAAIKIDESNAKGALKEIAEAKVMVPQMALTVIDRAVQAYGGAGVCQDTPLANMWAQIRTLRIADGPDEVHLQQMGKNENKRHRDIVEKLKVQKEKADHLLNEHGVQQKSKLLESDFIIAFPEIVCQARSSFDYRNYNHLLLRIKSHQHSKTTTTTLKYNPLQTMSPEASPLKARDVNTSLPSPTKSEKAPAVMESEKQPQTMEYHRQVLQSRLEEDKYVPSTAGTRPRGLTTD
ncbi:MAG: hypothetical protein L6R36_000545 [Xanthoria steineri]|nr:MAG: hypothetical protein L6R36_000545 [Xanthoria steineri]